MSNLVMVLVRFENEEHNYQTQVNSLCTDRHIERYFVGHYLQVGSAQAEAHAVCTSIVILR